MSAKSKGLGFLLLLLMVAVFITACGEGGEGGSAHNKGSDCLGCHGFSLAATVYQDTNNATPCNGAFHVQFLLNPTDTTPAIDSTTLGDVTSSGNFYVRGGYIKGTYYTRIIAGDGTVLAQSALPHTFTTGYNGSNPVDMNNRYSCNTCHKNPPVNGTAGSLFVQQNLNKCQ